MCFQCCFLHLFAATVLIVKQQKQLLGSSVVTSSHSCAFIFYDHLLNGCCRHEHHRKMSQFSARSACQALLLQTLQVCLPDYFFSHYFLATILYVYTSIYNEFPMSVEWKGDTTSFFSGNGFPDIKGYCNHCTTGII